MRRTYANGFSERALKDQAQNIEPYVEGLVQRLRREIEKAEKSKESLDIGKFYGYAALDIISDMTFGDSFHGLESDNGHDWIRGFFLGAKFGAVRNSLSYFYPLDRLFGMVFLRLTAKVRARNWKYAADRVKKRLEMAEAGIDRSDFVTPVIGHVTTEEEKGITLTELSNNSLAMVIAGCQLPTIALTTATYLLCKNLETYQRLQEEIRSSFAKAEDINLQSVQSLSYLSAVVDETLRLHHPTPIHLPRIVPPEGQLIDGQWIPGNVSTGNMLESAGLNVSQTIIGIALQTAQTSSLHWEDARGFHPERFLEPEHPWFDSRFSRDNKDIFHPYSIGNRNCIAAR
jgi:cytochrome P450